MSTITLAVRGRLERITGGASPKPLLILFGLNLVDELDRLAFATFTPEIRDAFGLSDTGIVAINSLTATFLLFAAVPIGMLGDRYARLKIVMGAALAWSSMSVMTGLARGVAMLMAVRLLAGIGRIANEIIHPSLLTDYYEAKVQPRVFAVHRLANSVGGFAAVIAALLAGVITWRGVFIVFAAPTLLLIFAASRLEEPARGASLQRRSFVITGERPKRALRQLWKIKTLRWQWICLFLLGLAIVAIPTFITLFLERVHGADVLSRGVEKWISGLGSVLGLGISGYYSGRATDRGRPDHLARIVAISAGSFAISLIAMALVPSLTLAIAMSFAVSVGGAAFQPAYYPLVGMVTPPELKTVSFGWGVMFIAVGAVGGVGIAAIGESQGFRSAFLMLSVIILFAAAAAWYSARFVLGDLIDQDEDDRGGDDDDPGHGGARPDGPDRDSGPDLAALWPTDPTTDFVPPEPASYAELRESSLGLGATLDAADRADVVRTVARPAALLAGAAALPFAVVAVAGPWLLLQHNATPRLLVGCFVALVGGMLWGTLLAPRLSPGGAAGGLHLFAAQLVGVGLLISGGGLLLPGLFIAGMGSGPLQAGVWVRAVEGVDTSARGDVVRAIRAGTLLIGLVAGLLVAIVRAFDRTPSLAIGLAGVCCLVAAAAATRLAPGLVGSGDRSPLAAVDRRDGEQPARLSAVWRQLRTSRSGPALLGAAAQAGAAVTLLLVHLTPLALGRWGASPAGAAWWVVAGLLGGAWLMARRGPADEVGSAGLPAQAHRLGGRLLVAGLVVVAGAFWTDLSALAVFAVGLALVLAVQPTVAHGLALTVPPQQRREAGRLVVVVAAASSLVALWLAALLEARVHESLALALGGVALALAGSRLQKASPHLLPDGERMVDRVVAAAALADHVAAGGDAPLLQCRSVEFAYGSVQVLHGIDFTVREGEIVALLGTNGAGKSTLLRVISGLGIPFGGSVRHAGQDITTLDPVGRVGRGIVQVPGGRATFGELTVEENVRSHAFALGRDRVQVEAAVDEALAYFPRLAERRQQLASTLSGGERQMLALTKALILQPKVLLIDELSLGLAPSIVGELLETVREINRRGTAIVLVEQSVNVALSVAHHAYYLDKGKVSFDGAADELLAQPDVLRSVYLAGAVDGLTTPTVGAPS